MSISFLGYIATVFIILSLSAKSIVKLRILNLIGAAIFVIYGGLIGAMPIILLNLLTSALNLHHLRKIYFRKEKFELLPAENQDEPYLKKYIDFHNNDILNFFNEIKIPKLNDPVIFYILRDMVTAGIFIAEIQQDSNGDRELLIHLDYVSPSYRDHKSARFFYCKTHELLADRNLKRYITFSQIKAHTNYLKRNSFSPMPERGDGWWQKSI